LLCCGEGIQYAMQDTIRDRYIPSLSPRSSIYEQNAMTVAANNNCGHNQTICRLSVATSVC
jgi:hypothetical protein